MLPLAAMARQESAKRLTQVGLAAVEYMERGRRKPTANDGDNPVEQLRGWDATERDHDVVDALAERWPRRTRERELRPEQRIGRPEQDTICFGVQRALRSEVLIQNEGRPVFGALSEVVHDHEVFDWRTRGSIRVQHGPSGRDVTIDGDASGRQHRHQGRVDIADQIERAVATAGTLPGVAEDETPAQMTASRSRRAVGLQHQTCALNTLSHHGEVPKSKSPRKASQKRSRSADTPGMRSLASVTVSLASPRTCSCTPRCWYGARKKKR